MPEIKVPEGFEVPEEAHSESGAQGLITYVVDDAGDLKILAFEGFPLPEDAEETDDEASAPEGADMIGMFRKAAGYGS